MKIILLVFLYFLIAMQEAYAQSVVYTGKTFAETRVVNGHSVETNNEGVLKFLIFHRFGALNAGIYDFFGFDDANMRIGFDYGLKDWLTVGVGRSSYEKTYDGYFKWKLLRQKKGEKNFPLTITWFSSAAFMTIRGTYPGYDVKEKHKMNYVNQALIARKFSETFSLQIMPSLIHRNLVGTGLESNDVIALGFAPKIQLTKKLSLNMEYYYVPPDQISDHFVNCFAIGFDIETKGHVFQLNFGNSRGLIEKVFIAETEDQWADGEIHFGFNLTRDFKLKGRPYRKYSE